MAAGPVSERNQDATVYVGGLDDQVTETILWDLFVQSGPIVNIHMPKDRVTQLHQGYGFVEFLGEEDADYAVKCMNMIKLYGKPVRVNKASTHQKNLDVGANIFIGNLDPEVDEKLLYDTFSAFGVILQTPKIMREQDTGNSKGFAFISFVSFDASDASIDAMNGQFLCNRPISVSYAFKRDAKGERHGSAAERLLAAQNPLSHADRPHQLFADAPTMTNQGPGPMPHQMHPDHRPMMHHGMAIPPPPPPPPISMSMAQNPPLPPLPPPPPMSIGNSHPPLPPGMPSHMMMPQQQQQQLQQPPPPPPPPVHWPGQVPTGQYPATLPPPPPPPPSQFQQFQSQQRWQHPPPPPPPPPHLQPQFQPPFPPRVPLAPPPPPPPPSS